MRKAERESGDRGSAVTVKILRDSIADERRASCDETRSDSGEINLPCRRCTQRSRAACTPPRRGPCDAPARTADRVSPQSQRNRATSSTNIRHKNKKEPLRTAGSGKQRRQPEPLPTQVPGTADPRRTTDSYCRTASERLLPGQKDALRSTLGAA